MSPFAKNFAKVRKKYEKKEANKLKSDRRDRKSIEFLIL